MMRNRVVLALVIGATLIGLIGLLRPDAMRTASREKWFWTWKTHSGKKYDIVFAGDSRTYRGISPESMADSLRGLRILNFGYSSGSLSPFMLTEAEKRLDAGGKRIIVLGITASSLTPRAARDEQYRQEKNRTTSEILENIYLAPFMTYFDPTTPIRFLEEIGSRKARSREAFYESGWIAAWKEPPGPPEALGVFANLFTDNRVSPALVEHVLLQTEKWTREGMRIYAFRPPTSPDMADMESRLSGFDEETFRQRFGRFGGVWIDVTKPGYHSYDHSHLDRESAQALSRVIAEAIKQSMGEQAFSLDPQAGSISRNTANPDNP
jgi:hypothetical protein